MAKQDIAAGRFRFLSICGYACELPGVGEMNCFRCYSGSASVDTARYFSSDDQLLTLALAASGGYGNPAVGAREWAGRSRGRRPHHDPCGREGADPKFRQGFEVGGPDTTYVHCAGWDDADWKMVAESGGTVSIPPGTEIFMSINIPPIQQALDAGVRPSFSVDAETNAPTSVDRS
jgi:5-methylthioadenosine/S-adenosylhomocysteine deaminase